MPLKSEMPFTIARPQDPLRRAKKVSSGGDDGRYLATSWRPVRLDTLVRLRWLAIAGQTAGVLFVDFGLGFPLPLIECLGADRALGRLQPLAHLPLRPRPPPQHRLRLGAARLRLRPARRSPRADRRAREPVLAAAPRAALGLGDDAAAALDLPSRRPRRRHRQHPRRSSTCRCPGIPTRRIVFDDVYVIGIWVSLVCGVVFISAYTNRVAHEARQLADALTATELALSPPRAALARSTASPPPPRTSSARRSRPSRSPPRRCSPSCRPGPLREDVELIISQSARCRAILAKLRNLGADGGDPFAAVPLQALLAEVAKPHEGQGKTDHHPRRRAARRSR